MAFNSSITFPKTIEVHQTTHEHRAPTDDSIRLFDEMRRKAIRSVVASGQTSLTVGKATWHVFNSPEIPGFLIHGVFVLNGKQIDFECRVTRMDCADYHGADLMGYLSGKVHESLIQRLVSELTQDLFRVSINQIAMAANCG